MLPDDMVMISHPDIEAVGGPVTKAAFDLVWAPLGWSVADESGSEPAADPPKPVRSKNV